MSIAIAEHITVVFTDFFDTLVSRTCHPEVVKRKWCAALIDAYSIPTSVDFLYQMRLRIESSLGFSNVQEGYDAEFNYIDLLHCFHAELKRLCLIGSIGDLSAFSIFAEEVELAIEESVQRPIQDNILLLERAKEKGMRVCVVSDFYLNSSALKRLANANGFGHLISAFYVSSHYRLTKKSGRLYQIVLEEERIKSPRNVLMVGDNHHSDFMMAGQNGLCAHHVPVDASKYDESYAKDLNRNLLKQSLQDVMSNKQFSFYWIAGPIFLFVRRLYWRLVGSQAKEVYFFSREGEFLKKVFDLYQNSLPLSYPKIKSLYLCVSRRSTYLPSLGELGDGCFDKLLNQYPACSLSDFLNSVGLNEHIQSFKELHPNVNFEEQHLCLPALLGYQQLIDSPHFLKVYNYERNKQRLLFRAYFYNVSRADQSQYFLSEFNADYFATIIHKILTEKSSCSINDFLKKINFCEHIDKFQGFYSDINFDEQHLFLPALSGYQRLISDLRFKKIYNDEREKRVLYLDDCFSNSKEDLVHVVDVGWKGSIQDNVGKILDKNLIGYYFGVFDGSSTNGRNHKEGLLFDAQFGIFKGNPSYMEFRAGFEVFMGATHGSTIKYNDDATPALEHNVEEQNIFEEFIRPFQEDALILCNQLSAFDLDWSLTDSELSDVANAIYDKCVLLPKKVEVDLFVQIKHYENFGLYNYSAFEKRYKTNKQYLFKLITEPKRTVSSAWWKPLDFQVHGFGFLKHPYSMYRKYYNRNLKRETQSGTK